MPLALIFLTTSRDNCSIKNIVQSLIIQVLIYFFRALTRWFCFDATSYTLAFCFFFPSAPVDVYTCMGYSLGAPCSVLFCSKPLCAYTPGRPEGKQRISLLFRLLLANAFFVSFRSTYTYIVCVHFLFRDIFIRDIFSLLFFFSVWRRNLNLSLYMMMIFYECDMKIGSGFLDFRLFNVELLMGKKSFLRYSPTRPADQRIIFYDYFYWMGNWKCFFMLLAVAAAALKAVAVSVTESVLVGGLSIELVSSFFGYLWTWDEKFAFASSE